MQDAETGRPGGKGQTGLHNETLSLRKGKEREALN